MTLEESKEVIPMMEAMITQIEEQDVYKRQVLQRSKRIQMQKIIG